MLAPHPALRVPIPGDGIGAGAWDDVRTTCDGIPILVPDPDRHLAAVGREATADFDALPYEALCHLARYLPGAVGEGQREPLRAAVRELVGRYGPADARLGVEAGCSVGPDLPALRGACAEVVAFDGNVAAARVAAALARGEAVPLLARREGRSFERLGAARRPALRDVHVVVGDALNPPLRAGVADVALAVNLLDNVREPVNLLGQLDAVLRPGGLLLLTSPFAWHDGITPAEEQLGGGTVPALAQLGSPAAVPALLRGETPLLPHLRYELLDERDVPWVLRDHARATFHYDVRVIAARKRG